MRLVSVLDEMIQAVQVSNISIQERLIIQTTAWELAFGLDWFGLNDAEMQRGLEPAIHRAVRLLKITPFSSDEAKRVPSTLGDLPRLAAAPEMASDVKSLLAHNPDIVEVTVPTELHADLLFGRFTARIFLTTTDPTSRVSFRQFVMEKNTQYKDLRDLPLKFAGIKAILVLYFNVLSSDLKIIPTEQVAFWHQYTFTEKTDLGLPFNEAANRIRFFTVAFENRLGRPSSADIAPITYKQISQKQMSRVGILDVKPAQEGEPVNSIRAQCLRCHLNQIATFDTHGVRKVAFSAPLIRSGQDLLTPYFKESIEPKLRQWNQKYPSLR